MQREHMAFFKLEEVVNWKIKIKNKKKKKSSAIHFKKSPFKS